jgi:mRNA degradation ribonuclease J1/J2
MRVHGTIPKMTMDFIQKAANEKLIALIIEGTRIADEVREESEELVFKESGRIVSTTNRLVLADFNFKDVDRLRTFLKVGKENDRKLVVKMNDVYFLKYLSKDPQLNVPTVDDEGDSSREKNRPVLLIIHCGIIMPSWDSRYRRRNKCGDYVKVVLKICYKI